VDGFITKSKRDGLIPRKALKISSPQVDKFIPSNALKILGPQKGMGMPK